MQFIKGMTIIFFCFIAGEAISIIFSLPVPGNVIGMLLLFTGLVTGMVKLKDVEEAGNLFIEHLVLFLIPATVGIIQYQEILKEQLLSIILVGAGGFLSLFVITSLFTDFLARKLDKKGIRDVD